MAGFTARVLDALLTATGTVWMPPTPLSLPAWVTKGTAAPLSKAARLGIKTLPSSSPVAPSSGGGRAGGGEAGGSAVAGAAAPAPPRPLPVKIAGFLLVSALFAALTLSGALGTWREMLNNAKVYDDAGE